jgi:hypothetical protein
MRGSGGEDLRGQNPRRALAGRFKCNSFASLRGFVSGVNLWNARPFLYSSFRGWGGVAESIGEAEAREGWLFGTRIKALKGESVGGFGLKDGHSLGCPIK